MELVVVVAGEELVVTLISMNPAAVALNESKHEQIL